MTNLSKKIICQPTTTESEKHSTHLDTGNFERLLDFPTHSLLTGEVQIPMKVRASSNIAVFQKFIMWILLLQMNGSLTIPYQNRNENSFSHLHPRNLIWMREDHAFYDVSPFKIWLFGASIVSCLNTATMDNEG